MLCKLKHPELTFLTRPELFTNSTFYQRVRFEPATSGLPVHQSNHYAVVEVRTPITTTIKQNIILHAICFMFYCSCDRGLALDAFCQKNCSSPTGIFFQNGTHISFVTPKLDRLE